MGFLSYDRRYIQTNRDYNFIYIDASTSTQQYLLSQLVQAQLLQELQGLQMEQLSSQFLSLFLQLYSSSALKYSSSADIIKRTVASKYPGYTISKNTNIKVLEYPGINISRLQNIPEYKYQGIKVSRYQNIQVTQYPRIQISRYQSIQV